MVDDVSCSISEVENYKKSIIDYYKMQITRFKQLKIKFEKSNWNDDKYIERLNQINICLKKIADAIDQITNGVQVRVIDNFLNQAYEYIDTRKNYPK